MYSPKIKDELIPKIYQVAKAKGVSMTALVNEILKNALKRMEGRRDGCSNENGGGSIRGPG